MQNKVDEHTWKVYRYLMRKYGTKIADIDIYPLRWYINTGRASAAYLRAFLSVKPYMVGRKLHNGGGSHDDALARVNDYITGKVGI